VANLLNWVSGSVKGGSAGLSVFRSTAVDELIDESATILKIDVAAKRTSVGSVGDGIGHGGGGVGVGGPEVPQARIALVNANFYTADCMSIFIPLISSLRQEPRVSAAFRF